VVQVLDKSFDVLAGRLGIVRRVYCDVSFFGMDTWLESLVCHLVMTL